MRTATLVMRVPARRFSSAAPAATAASSSGGPLSALSRWFQGQPIEDLPEMKTLRAAEQLVAHVPANATAQKLTTPDSQANLRSWFKNYQTEKSLSTVDQEAFAALMKDVTAFIESTEKALLNDQPKISAALDEEVLVDDTQRAVRDAYVEALALKLARHKCLKVSADFAQLDADQDGSVTTADVEQLLLTAIEGSDDDWLRYQFRLHDTDGDDIVNEAESKAILDAIIVTQKNVFAELFEAQVADLPKKPAKVIANAIEETHWKEKIPEKVRCVFHFAAKEDEANKTIHWETFKENQEIEIPELHSMLRVYTKGIYNDRYAFYEYKQEKRSRRIKGLLLALSLVVGDVIFAII